VGEHDRAEFPGTQAHRRKDGSQVGMQSDHEQGLRARRLQGCEAELRLIARVSGKKEFNGTDAHGVQSLRIIEAQKAVRKSAIGGELRHNGGDVAASALHPAG
jgi:hypothetical protein